MSDDQFLIKLHKEKFMNNTTSSSTQAATQASPTMGSMMGEIVWLMSQSPIHKILAISDLEWLLMPPLLLGQYKLFYNDTGFCLH